MGRIDDKPTFLWEDDGVALTPVAIDRLISWCSGLGASRIFFQTDQSVWIRLHGRNHRVTSQPLYNADVEQALDHFCRGRDGVSMVRKGEAVNRRHTVWPDRRSRRYSFRLHAHGTLVGTTEGIAIILRPLVDIPRAVTEQHVEPELLEAMDQGPGLYPICGMTGSGKTTVIGGFVRRWLEAPDGNYNIIEGSAPIEVLYDLIDQPSSTIDQTEIPRHFLGFDKFIEGCVRSEPTHIIVGECNNPATMTAALQGGISGHALLTSLHTLDCPATIRRIIGLCPDDQRDSLTLAAAEGLKVLVNQRLLPSTDGRRTPVRSFIRFNRERRARLLDAPTESWPNIIRDLVDQHGQSFAVAIQRAHAEGRITDQVAADAMKMEA